MHLVWFKRDLRIRDHAPLSIACGKGNVACLYIFEPAVFDQEDHDSSHLLFVLESLRELTTELGKLGVTLLLFHGDAPEVFDILKSQIPFSHLWSHEETGGAVTYRRDRQVAAWCRNNRVKWTEIPQTGVVRPLHQRDGWSKIWLKRMNEPLVTTPEKASAPEPSNLAFVRDKYHGPGLFFRKVPTLQDLGVPPSGRKQVQQGGERHACDTLDSFLSVRSVNYQGDMSSPVTAWEGCSRLSAYLAYGNISMRTIHQATNARIAELKELRAAGGEVPGPWVASLSSFARRLRWHCHFMQKLEDEPSIEFRNMSRAYDGMRNEKTNEWSEVEHQRFSAWTSGMTGYPLVDACMRCLHGTGWINFRMRAMLMSFASHHLWLHWRPTSVYLARLFLDFEPGIHYSQAQMQSGTTGINTVRIYSPIKQVIDQDPKGEFIKRWVPELEGVTSGHLPEPWKMSTDQQMSSGCVIGRVYPEPIVDHPTAYREARQRIHSIKRMSSSRAEAERVYEKHGSRRRPSPRRK